MNPIFIILPTLFILMFVLGLSLQKTHFVLLAKAPKPIIVGLIGQLILLPCVGFVIVSSLSLPPVFLLGILLIACCPGGSSSNLFTLLAKGNIALSVVLTTLSSLITLITLPLIMQWGMAALFEGASSISLPIKQLLLQNAVLNLLPIALGFTARYYCPRLADRIAKPLTKLIFPALATVAILFFIDHQSTIIEHIALLGSSILLLLLVSMMLSAALSRLTHQSAQNRKTIVIEVGMQNAAQAIALASSPFVFNAPEMAIPAIIYALLMNVVLLVYVSIVQKK